MRLYFKGLKCSKCGSIYSETKFLEKCPSCGEKWMGFSAVYDFPSLSAVISKEKIASRERSLWRYLEILPLSDEKHIISRLEGWTPLYKSKKLSRQLGLSNLLLKDETVNPSGSFKDRGATVTISKAVELGFKNMIVASSGNFGAAIARCCAIAGLSCHVLTPFEVSLDKLTQIMVYGSGVVKVRGPVDNARNLTGEVYKHLGIPSANVQFRPMFSEGLKTTALEICEQLGWKAPKRLIVPTGSGQHLLAIWKGLNELVKVGLVDELPTRLVAAQAEGCPPYVNALKRGKEYVEPVVPCTIATGLAVSIPAEGALVLNAVRQSHGTAEAASDQEILNAMKLLAKTEGVYAEPSGAVAIAVLKKMVEAGEIEEDEEIVCVITGSGLKDQKAAWKLCTAPPEINANLEELRKIIQI